MTVVTKRNPWACLIAGLLSANLAAVSAAQPEAAGDDSALSGSSSAEEVVDYPARFFDRYRPNTALDMIRQVPGFELDDGSDQRGFGVAAGNVLINSRRPSTKQDKPSDLLSRIPASLVGNIALIRGQLPGLDLRGYSVVANVRLREDVPAAIRWEVSSSKYFEQDRLPLAGSISMSDHWQGIDYNTGLELERSSESDVGREDVFNALGDLDEVQFENGMENDIGGNANLNASSWVGQTRLHVNAEVGIEDREESLFSRRAPQTNGAGRSTETIVEETLERQVELGLDAERRFFDDYLAKGILLYSMDSEDASTSENIVNSAGEPVELNLLDTDTLASEAIARLELDWTGWEDHHLQLNLEGAYNLLDNAEVQTLDSGSGPVLVDVPGADARVEEFRGDALIKDTWSLGEWDLDYGIAAEVSTISQSGDASRERSFFFLKPLGLLTWAPSQDRQTRLRVSREVAQLDFRDFVSVTEYEDDELLLGNPDLVPDKIWVSELSHERRFGELGVVTLTAFHHWITDVQDLLPITETEEAPGNIGDGRRWGLGLEGTMPLSWLGLAGARLDMRAYWQDSTVTDPVTGEPRRLSDREDDEEVVSGGYERDYAMTLDFRQDFDARRFAWGWDMTLESEETLFKVDELETSEDGVELNAFIETTRWWDMKLRLEANNLLNRRESRNRTFYQARRGLSPVSGTDLRERVDGREIVLSLSGSF